MSTPWTARQGDVLIVRMDQLPEGARPVDPDNGRVILAYGEVTGHAHALDESVARLFEVSGVEDRFLEVTEDTADLKHEEHGTIPLEKGVYQIRIQKQMNIADLGEAPQRVVD